MSKIKDSPVHWPKAYGKETVCGVFINGITIRHAIFPSDVTCKKCLKYLERYAVCPKCGCEFLKVKNDEQLNEQIGK